MVPRLSDDFVALVLVDELHHDVAPTWRLVLERFQECAPTAPRATGNPAALRPDTSTYSTWSAPSRHSTDARHSTRRCGGSREDAYVGAKLDVRQNGKLRDLECESGGAIQLDQRLAATHTCGLRLRDPCPDGERDRWLLASPT